MDRERGEERGGKRMKQIRNREERWKKWGRKRIVGDIQEVERRKRREKVLVEGKMDEQEVNGGGAKRSVGRGEKR